MSYSTARHTTGAVCYWISAEQPSPAYGATELFFEGEIWGIDTFYLDVDRSHSREYGFPFIPTGALEAMFLFSLQRYVEFARGELKVSPPLRVQCGIVGVAGYRLAVDERYFHYDRFAGHILRNDVVFSGEIADGKVDAATWLKPFFEEIYDAAGVVRPDV
jgi:hypothetical protein